MLMIWTRHFWFFSRPVEETKDGDPAASTDLGDKIVFGTEDETPEIAEESEEEESGSETEGDSESTTSWEDMSHFNPDLLLYKAAKVTYHKHIECGKGFWNNLLSIQYRIWKLRVF